MGVCVGGGVVLGGMGVTTRTCSGFHSSEFGRAKHIPQKRALSNNFKTGRDHWDDLF